MTLSLAAVFIPVLFMGGVLGRLLHEFAVTIMSAIVVSGFVSLTLTPMLCSRFLKPPHEEKHGRLFNFFEGIQDGLTHVYDRCLQVVLRHKLATMIGVALSCWSARSTSTWSSRKASCRARTSINSMSRPRPSREFRSTPWCEHQQEINRILLSDPNVAYVMSQMWRLGREP